MLYFYVMKKISIFFLISISILFLSCTSTKISQEEPVEEVEEVIEEDLFGKRYIDWKYKGFGSQLPPWIDSAFDNSIEEVRSIIPQLAEKKILILRVDSETLDQAELAINQGLENGISLEGDIYTLYERFWVMLADDFIQKEGCPYTSLAILVVEESGL